MSEDDVEESVRILKEGSDGAVDELRNAADLAKQQIEDGQPLSEFVVFLLATDLSILPVLSALYKLYTLNFFSILRLYVRKFM
jgi:hypothetical protein